MSTTSIVNMLYLGNFADVDTDESDFDTESGNALVRNYGKPPNISVTENDQNDDGLISDDEDNSAGDTLSYDLGAGQQVSEIDSTSWYRVELTLGDGSVITVNPAILQTNTGDVFLRDLNNELDNLNIQNVRITEFVESNYIGSYSRNSVENTRMVCFLHGTKISTVHGEIPIEQLRVGDLVLTADNGAQPIKWIGSGRLAYAGKHAPIVIEQNALAAGIPARDLKVSPQHRILVDSPIAERMFGRREVLLPAHRLIGLRGIRQSSPRQSVRYWHIFTQKHQLVRANGAWAETLYPGREALLALCPEARAELAAILPLSDVAYSYDKARFEPIAPKQKKLIARHCKNAKPMVCGAPMASPLQ